MWPDVALGSLLFRTRDSVTIQPDCAYMQVTVRLHHKGVVARGRQLGSEIKSHRQFKVRGGQLLLSRIDARNGAMGLVPPAIDGAIVTSDFWSYEIDRRQVEPSFLDYYLGTAEFVDRCRHASEGSTNRVRLREDKFLALTVPLPKRDEQEQVVRRLRAIEVMVKEMQSLADEIDLQAEALCRAVLNEGAAVPTAMGEVLRLRRPDILVQPSEVYDFAGVYSFGRGIFRGPRKLGSEFSYKRLTRITAGNFVYPKLMAWEGAVGVVPFACDGLYVSPEFPVFELDQTRVLPDTLDVYFRTPSVWPLLGEASKGTNLRRRRLHPREFLRIQMLLPGLPAQERLHKIRRAMAQARELRMRAQQEMAAVAPSAVHSVFSAARAAN